MADTQSVRDFSRALFNNAYVLEVAAAIAGFADGAFTSTQVARRLGVERNVVATALAHLEKAALIKRAHSDGRHRPFERQPSAFWTCAEQLVQEV